MKILVVDDDEGVRLFLQRLLKKKYSCSVVEAKDGLEALKVIQAEDPDMAIMDVRMPFLNGEETLESIRSDPTYASLPVIVMSVVSDREMITRLIKHGISGYILKPLLSESVCQRVTEVFARVKNHHKHTPKVAIKGDERDEKRILVVDKDINFRVFFESVMGSEFEIREAETGPAAIQTFLEKMPSIVLIGEGLSLMNENLLARKLRDFDANGGTSVYLCTEGHRENVQDATVFDGVVRKSFVPEVFRRDFMRVVMQQQSILEQVMDIIQRHLSSELLTATRQVIGVITMQETTVLEPEATAQIVDEVYAMVDLTDPQEGVVVTVALIGSSANMFKLAEIILGGAVTSTEESMDAFGELINTVGGRVRSSIEARGVKVENSPPRVTLKSQLERQLQWNLAVPFRTDAGQEFFVGVAVAGQEEALERR